MVKAPPGDKAPLSTVPTNPRPTRNAGRASSTRLLAVKATATMSGTIASTSPATSPKYPAAPLAAPRASHRRIQVGWRILRTLLVQHYPLVHIQERTGPGQGGLTARTCPEGEKRVLEMRWSASLALRRGHYSSFLRPFRDARRSCAPVGASVCDVKVRGRELRVMNVGVGAESVKPLELCLWAGLVGGCRL